MPWPHSRRASLDFVVPVYAANLWLRPRRARASRSAYPTSSTTSSLSMGRPWAQRKRLSAGCREGVERGAHRGLTVDDARARRAVVGTGGGCGRAHRPPRYGAGGAGRAVVGIGRGRGALRTAPHGRGARGRRDRAPARRVGTGGGVRARCAPPRDMGRGGADGPRGTGCAVSGTGEGAGALRTAPRHAARVQALGHVDAVPVAQSCCAACAGSASPGAGRPSRPRRNGDDSSDDDRDPHEDDEHLLVWEVEHGDREAAGVDRRVECGVEEPSDQHAGAGSVVEPARDHAAREVRQHDAHQEGGESPRTGVDDKRRQVEQPEEDGRDRAARIGPCRS